jgi:hypothetical protein
LIFVEKANKRLLIANFVVLDRAIEGARALPPAVEQSDHQKAEEKGRAANGQH